jgi:anti-sigma B factor antagonist
MAADLFEATPRTQKDAVIIDLRGEVNRDSHDALTGAYSDGSGSKVILNFENVDYINSTGIAVIVGLLGQARRDGRDVMAFGLTDHYVEIFEITQLSAHIKLFPDENSALAAAGAA